MQIKYTQEKEDGAVVFQGILEGKELSFVIEVGLESLIRAGLLPFTSTNEDQSRFDVFEAPDMEQ